MKKLLTKLSSFQELIIVSLTVFGWLIFQSNVQFFRYIIHSDNTLGVKYYYSNYSYLSILIYELIIIGVMAVFLEIRNWRVNDFPIRITWKAIGAGFLLLFLNNIILNTSLYLPFFSELSEGVKSVTMADRSTVSIPLVILATSIVNPFFEEIFLIGYLGKWFEKYSSLMFISISTIIRVSYHTYQGFFGIYSVAIIGITLTIYFIKYRNLTPVIVTHMLFNLGYYVRAFYFNESP